MNGTLGHTGVLLGFVAALVGIAVLVVGLVRGRPGGLTRGRVYAPLILLGGVVAVVAMQRALVTHDFSLTYVADNNSRVTPLIYSITGMWSALAGSILLWGVILGGYATAMVWRFRARSDDPLVAWATLVMYAVAAFFFGLMLGPADPFTHVTGAVPTNGLGPNVLLQDNPLVLFHPPMLYLGLVGFTLPFAFVVLLGTVFPLLYEALNSGAQVAVGAPYFNRLIIPLGLGLLFLMAVAPALPWRKSSAEVMRGRLAIPAAIGVLVVVGCVIGGIHGIEPLLAFGLGAFAASSAGRALVLSVRGAWRRARASGQSPARATLAAWRGLVGRANGGMIVHIGVVIIAVGLAGATAFGHRGTVVLVQGQTGSFAGHSVKFVGTRTVRTPSHVSRQALLVVDGGATFTPAIIQFGAGTQAVGTPAVDSGVTADVYLTINSIPDKGGSWTFGGALVVVGSVLSAIPGRRRRPTDPVSAPVAGTAPLADPDLPASPPVVSEPVGVGDPP